MAEYNAWQIVVEWLARVVSRGVPCAWLRRPRLLEALVPLLRAVLPSSPFGQRSAASVFGWCHQELASPTGGRAAHPSHQTGMVVNRQVRAVCKEALNVLRFLRSVRRRANFHRTTAPLALDLIYQQQRQHRHDRNYA